MNRHTLGLAFFAAVILAASMLHDPGVLAALAVVGLLAAWPHTRWVAARTLVFPLLFAGVTLGAYALFGLWQNGKLPDTLPSMLLRVAAMSVWSFALVKKVDLVHALEGFGGIQFLLVVTRSQITLFAQSAEEAGRAYRSRTITPPSLAARWRFYAALYAALLEKALHQSKTVARAMRSRGLFDA
jgi:hypothetical protein